MNSPLRMPHSPDSLYPLVLIGTLAALTFWLNQSTQEHLPGTSAKLRHDPDYVIDRFVVRRYDLDGRLQHTLAAEQLTHYPDNDVTEVSQPRLTYHRRPASEVTARIAYLHADGNRLTLQDQVSITRRGTAGHPASRLTTAQLELSIDAETASTAQPVNLAQGRSTVRADSLQADNRQRQYLLNGNVRGLFYRNSSPQP